MKIHYMSRAQASLIVPPKTAALISVYEVQAEEENMKDAIACSDVKEVDLSRWAHAVRVQFWDIDQSFKDGETTYEPMSKEDAKKILDFIEKLPPEVDTIVVHCFAGASRSAAIAKFLMERVYDMPEEATRVSQAYNRYVYTRLLDEWWKRKEERHEENEAHR